MSWTTINWACGHKGEKKIEGNSRQRENRAQWESKNKCMVCWLLETWANTEDARYMREDRVDLALDIARRKGIRFFDEISMKAELGINLADSDEGEGEEEIKVADEKVVKKVARKVIEISDKIDNLNFCNIEDDEEIEEKVERLSKAQYAMESWLTRHGYSMDVLELRAWLHGGYDVIVENGCDKDITIAYMARWDQSAEQAIMEGADPNTPYEHHRAGDANIYTVYTSDNVYIVVADYISDTCWYVPINNNSNAESKNINYEFKGGEFVEPVIYSHFYNLA